MIITDQAQFIKNGDPIEELTVDGSRFDRISIRLGDDEIVVRARHVNGGEVVEQTFETVDDKLFKPVVPTSIGRRDVDDDLQDALGSIGYAAVDGDVIDV